MSLEIVREVSRENPDLLPTNLGRTCYRHTALVVQRLRERGHEAYLMCKSPGESQFTPPGFTARTVIGLDGKVYPCSGVSHDAIWCDGQQFDTLGSANEYDRPIYRRQGEPNWSFDPKDGPQIIATPNWSAVPQQYWRMNNPPLMDGPTPQPVPTPGPAPQPTPQPGGRFPYPDEGTIVKALQDRVKAAYKAVGRNFPDPNDSDAYRHFARFGYDAHDMDGQAAADKRIRELRQELGAPPE